METKKQIRQYDSCRDAIKNIQDQLNFVLGVINREEEYGKLDDYFNHFEYSKKIGQFFVNLRESLMKVDAKYDNTTFEGIIYIHLKKWNKEDNMVLYHGIYEIIRDYIELDYTYFLPDHSSLTIDLLYNGIVNKLVKDGICKSNEAGLFMDDIKKLAIKFSLEDQPEATENSDDDLSDSTSAS